MAKDDPVAQEHNAQDWKGERVQQMATNDARAQEHNVQDWKEEKEAQQMSLSKDSTGRRAGH
eukprot:1144657-Pelagomonas_calceolata.AAC.12